MTVQQLVDALASGQALSEEALAILDLYLKGDPEAEVPVEVLEKLIPILTNLTTKALLAWSVASKQPITVETVTALMPDMTPLTPPKD